MAEVGAPAIILPSEFTQDEDRIYGRTHSLRDEWLMARLSAWFNVDVESPKVWIAVLHEGGKWFYWSKSGGQPPVDKRDYARRVVSFLNKECHHDGAWLGGWTDEGFKRFYLLFKDRDGDIQFPIDTATELPWRELRRWALEDWGNLATGAFEQYVAAIKALELTEGQAVKLAQGQKLN